MPSKTASQPSPPEVSLDQVFVKLPYVKLCEGGFDFFLERGMHPEICFGVKSSGRLEPADMLPLAAALAERGLNCTVHAPFLGLDFGASDPHTLAEARTALERTLRLVEVLRPCSVVVHGGLPMRMDPADHEHWNERALPLLDWTARAALDLGTRVMLENICHALPGQLAPLLEALDGAAGWCLDAGHMHAFSNVPLEEWVDLLGRHLGQLHLHDNDGSGDQHRCIGQGRIDFARLFAAIRRGPNPARPVVTLEVNFREDVETSLQALGPIWPWPA